MSDNTAAPRVRAVRSGLRHACRRECNERDKAGLEIKHPGCCNMTASDALILLRLSSQRINEQTLNQAHKSLFFMRLIHFSGALA